MRGSRSLKLQRLRITTHGRAEGGVRSKPFRFAPGRKRPGWGKERKKESAHLAAGDLLDGAGDDQIRPAPGPDLAAGSELYGLGFAQGKMISRFKRGGTDVQLYDLGMASIDTGQISARGPVSRILSCAVIPLGAALPPALISDLPGGFGRLEP